MRAGGQSSPSPTYFFYQLNIPLNHLPHSQTGRWFCVSQICLRSIYVKSDISVTQTAYFFHKNTELFLYCDNLALSVANVLVREYGRSMWHWRGWEYFNKRFAQMTSSICQEHWSFSKSICKWVPSMRGVNWSGMDMAIFKRIAMAIIILHALCRNRDRWVQQWTRSASGGEIRS